MQVLVNVSNVWLIIVIILCVGARDKIALQIKKLRDRPTDLQKFEEEINSQGAEIKATRVGLMTTHNLRKPLNVAFIYKIKPRNTLRDAH